METEQQKKRLSSRARWTIIILLGFVLLGIASGLANSRLGDNYSIDSLEGAAKSIVNSDK
jgi:uncharacterized membrane protein YwaF